MGAPRKNKNAVGNKGGRPIEYDLKVEAEALLKFAENEDSLIFREFACLRNYPPENLSRWANDDVEFSQAYKKAKNLIGCRRERLMLKNKINPIPFSRYAGLYDMELKNHDKEMRKAAEEGNEKTVTYTIVKYADKESN